MKIIKRILFVLALVTVFILGYGAWILFGNKTSNPNNYKTVGDIPAPWGYERCEGSDSQYCSYLRLLPLRRKGSEVMLYTGGRARFQSLNYAVVDIPLLSNAEQCADVCIRLRAEYLYYSKQYGNIHFKDVNGNTMRYSGGASRKSFENYLRRVYGVASTYSLSREMKTRRLSDMQPGDVFVLLAEGNTPARNIHIMRNFENPFHSPWFFLDDDADLLLLSVFTYKSKELRHF